MTKRVLEEAGAPRGSELRFRNDSGRPRMKFGTQECLAIYLDGVSLPQEVYAALDLAAVVKQVEDALGLGGKALRGSWAPNGSRLSCGRNAQRRKGADRLGKSGRETTQFFP